MLAMQPNSETGAPAVGGTLRGGTVGDLVSDLADISIYLIIALLSEYALNLQHRHRDSALPQ